MALNFDFDTRESLIVDLSLHQPVDVEVRRGTFKDAKDFSYNNGVVFIAESGSSAIHFIDIEGNAVLKPKRLKTGADLVSQLTRFGLPIKAQYQLYRNNSLPI